MKSLVWVVLALAASIFVEGIIRRNTSWLQPLSGGDREFIVEQLRMYAQLLTAIFSIYFATIGIILSAGYTRLRRDIIQLLTSEQVGSVYSRVLVLAAVFCLTATSLPMFGFEPGFVNYILGTFLTLASSLALFPLGQRLFNFFDLNQLARSEILPSIARHIEGAANPKNSISLANHHSKAARQSLEQLAYIDDRLQSEAETLGDTLPALSDDYSALMLHYLRQKHKIDHESYWFPRKRQHKQWFFAGDSATSMALQTSSQLTVEEKADLQWFEGEIVDRLMGHIGLALGRKDYELALRLISRFSARVSTYAEQFQFEIGMQELKKIKDIIERSFASPDAADDSDMTRIAIADTWAALGSNLCLETLRRMMTFEKELKEFFDADVWTDESLHSLPAFLQVELAFIVERIDFERQIEGQRLSKPKYVQQLAVQKLLQQYAKIVPEICSFHAELVPNFVKSLTEMKMSEAATQVVLASLHSHWKLPRWFEELTQLFERYGAYMHYSETQYALPQIDTQSLAERLSNTRDESVALLASPDMIGHIFEHEHSDDFPDHFGQIYFELAEACIQALQQNDEDKFGKVFPMFFALALLASDTKFADPTLDVNDEFRLHLISTVINDLASVLGFAILYGEYFDNAKLSIAALAKFSSWIEKPTDQKQYLKRMLLISNPHSFSMGASPRGLIRIGWKMAFEQRARSDGYGDQISYRRGNPHESKVVNEFLRSHAEASHLFFAMQVLPLVDPADFDMDRQITSLASHLREDDAKGSE
ncbi:hypothetical protein KUD11_02440 [Roseovarius sp. LXJ103]|uniref:hypothetical protein n=1 Tax=Roseovarius carneus TaxID=2853164 RepID=UPI001C630D31|nr:hypothetical protein [Roseovarius carneus]MBZ8117499.1 hypothetical protein [Roseovarius carneus]